ncbi:MAG: hypothetical protein ISP86_05955 [Shewanellaceae bacterium]|nr:hypothetical protein [Shewanellaceae bacterium]
MKLIQLSLIVVTSIGLQACGDEASEVSASASTPTNLTYISDYAEFIDGHSSTYGLHMTASDDGQFVAVSTPQGTNNCNDNIVTDPSTCTNTSPVISGAVHMYQRDVDTKPILLLKPNQSLTNAAKFGHRVSMTADGMWLAVAAPFDSLTGVNCVGIVRDYKLNCTGVATTGQDGYDAGAIYLFKRDNANTSWVLHQIIKHEHAQDSAFKGYAFGDEIAFSKDGTTFVVGRKNENLPTATGVTSTTQPTTVSSTAFDYGIVYVYLFDPSLGIMKFKQTATSDQTKKMGQWLHSLESDILVSSSKSISLVNASSSGMLQLISTDDDDVLKNLPVTFDDTNEMIYRHGKLYIGVPTINSDCVGVINANHLPDGKTTVQACLNNDGSAADSGAVLVYEFPTDENGAVQPTLTEILLQETPTANNKFGRSLTLSEDGKQLFIGHNDDKDCTGIIKSFDDDCANPASVPNVGAIQQYTRTDGTWTKTDLIKPTSIQSGTAAYFGDHLKAFQFKNQFFFSSALSNHCPGMTNKDVDPCLDADKNSAINGLITHYEIQ